jgi:hypothetical protein
MWALAAIFGLVALVCSTNIIVRNHVNRFSAAFVSHRRDGVVAVCGVWMLAALSAWAAYYDWSIFRVWGRMFSLGFGN